MLEFIGIVALLLLVGVILSILYYRFRARLAEQDDNYERPTTIPLAVRQAEDFLRRTESRPRKPRRVPKLSELQ